MSRLLALLLLLPLAGELRPVPEGRGALEIPEDIWAAALAGLDRPGRPLGFTAEEMANYSGRAHLLRTVENLFRDARTLPRFSGSLATSLVENARKPWEVVRIAWGLTDAVAGRMLPIDLPPAPDGTPGLPPAEGRFVARLAAAIREAAPWLRAAFADLDPAALSYAFATAPLVDEREGQMASLDRAAFDALDAVDRDYLAFGSVVLLARISAALDEYAAAEKGPVAVDFSPLSLDTPVGRVRVLGPGDDVIEGAAVLTVDLGGNDRWVGRQGANRVADREFPVGLAVDLGGNDVWDAGEEKAALGCGLFGFGAVLDLGGDDTWRSAESGLGCAWFGTGLLLDFAGNDRYETATHWGQGVGYAGVGALIDLEGDDEYVIGFDGQGYGATLGAGLLLDVAGDDSYLARDDGNVSALYLGQSVSMAQGVGQGRRADLGDGHSLAGGFGVLVDGAGDDDYHATCWSHGAGYWWAVGILEDLGGNDTYRDGKYSLGAGAHFAIGVCADLSGDDEYNVGYAEAVNQYQGHARDGSIGVFVDGDGNDRYQLRAHCGGSGDLASIALFWDRRGDDVYEITATEIGGGGDWGGTPPLGSSSFYEPMRSWRDDLDTCGVFLDTGGKDEYRGPEGPWGNDREWPSRRGLRFRGYGRDAEEFAPAARGE